MEDDYTSVRTVFFNKFENSPCDLYLRLSDKKFVKILNKNNEMPSAFIEKYVSKKIFEFFLTKNDFLSYQDVLFDFHSKAREVLINGKKVHLPQHEGLNNLMEQLGINELQTKKINDISNRLVKELNSEKTILSSLIGRFTTNNSRFPYDHSYLTAMISCLIADGNEWGTTPNKEKLCLASILHELGNDDQTSLEMEAHLKSQDLVNGYPTSQVHINSKLAEKLKDTGSIPIDVISIIESTHNFNFSNLSPMTCCFVVGHQFVIELYKEKFNPGHMEIIFKRMKGIFTEGNPAKQLEVLTKSI